MRQVYDASSFHRCRVRHLGDVWWNHCVEVEDRANRGKLQRVRWDLPSQTQDEIVVDKGLGWDSPTKNPIGDCYWVGLYTHSISYIINIILG